MKIMNLSDVMVYQRHQILSLILFNREILLIFTRDVQYLAIAIIDQFLISLINTRVQVHKNKDLSYYSFAALIIATKFLRNDKLNLKNILTNLKTHNFSNQIIQNKLLFATEHQILQRIDFMIPESTCYLVLQNHLKSEKVSKKRKQTQIKTTIKLLKEISILTFQLTQNPQIAKQLYELVQTKNSTERVKNLYKIAISSLKDKNQVKV